jgi:small subunit ribosomal protein S6e
MLVVYPAVILKLVVRIAILNRIVSLAGIPMVEIVLDIADPRSGKTYHVKLDSTVLIGKRIGEEIIGDQIGFPGYKLKITGGTDRDGFPHHPGVHGMGKTRAILPGPPGFHPRKKGERRAKMVRGNIISEYTKQVNLKIVEYGEKSLEELLKRVES